MGNPCFFKLGQSSGFCNLSESEQTFDKKSHCLKGYKEKQVLFLCLTRFEQLPLSPASTESKRDRCSSSLPGGKSSAAAQDQFSLVR